MKYFFVLVAFFCAVGCGKIKHELRGEMGSPGAAGVQGPMGPQGPVGPAGQNGTSCSVVDTAEGVLITCSDGTFAEVMNGQTVETVELCPELSGGVFKEYLIYVDGVPFGVYAKGQTIGLTKLWPGNWQTTDGRNCHFTIGE
jgi:hypothetical protein